MKLGILSRDATLYSTRKLAEVAEEKGHEVQIIDHLKCNLIMQEDRPQVHYKNENLEGFDAIIPRIGTSVTFFGAAVVRQFEMMNTFSAADSNAILRSRDKLRSLQVLSREGLGLPKTVFTNFSKEKDDVIKSVGGAPLIIKLLEGTQGLGVVLAETKKAAESVLDAFNGLKARVIVQEYIKESKGSDIRVFVVGGKVVGAMKRTGKEGEFRSNLHRGGSAQVIKLSKEERLAAIKAVKAMGLDIAGVDLLQSERGPLILEVNSSPGLEGIEKATGKNVAGAIIEFIENAISKRAVSGKFKG
ncbi:MAG: 30S ribosomal protein S6--L-glutamate ligase [Chitinophagales bacterium]